MTTESLFETHRSRLFGLAYKLLGSRSDAEDVVQEPAPLRPAAVTRPHRRMRQAQSGNGDLS